MVRYAQLTTFVLLAGWLGTATLVLGDHPVPASTKVACIRLVIDYGDGIEKHFTKLPFRSGMVVFDAMLQARSVERGIKIEYRGKKATLFVSKIDDLKNEGRGRNWIYSVNGKQPDRSCGIYPLKPGDVVLWRFGKY